MKTREDFTQPGRPFAARDTPAAALVRIEAHDEQRHLHLAGVFIHDDYTARAEHGFLLLHGVIIHGQTLSLLGGEQRAGRYAGLKRMQFISGVIADTDYVYPLFLT